MRAAHRPYWNFSACSFIRRARTRTVSGSVISPPRTQPIRPPDAACAACNSSYAATSSGLGFASKSARRLSSASQRSDLCSSRQISNLRRFHGERTAAPSIHAANCSLSRSHARGRKSGLQLSINFSPTSHQPADTPKLAAFNHQPPPTKIRNARPNQPKRDHASTPTDYPRTEKWPDSGSDHPHLHLRLRAYEQRLHAHRTQRTNQPTKISGNANATINTRRTKPLNPGIHTADFTTSSAAGSPKGTPYPSQPTTRISRKTTLIRPQTASAALPITRMDRSPRHTRVAKDSSDHQRGRVLCPDAFSRLDPSSSFTVLSLTMIEPFC